MNVTSLGNTLQYWGEIQAGAKNTIDPYWAQHGAQSLCPHPPFSPGSQPSSSPYLHSNLQRISHLHTILLRLPCLHSPLLRVHSLHYSITTEGPLSILLNPNLAYLHYTTPSLWTNPFLNSTPTESSLTTHHPYEFPYLHPAY